MHNLSQQVHRIGYHFPSAVVATVCMDLGLYLTSSGKVMPFQGITSHRSHMRAASEVSQTTINTEARDVIRDLFPNIPEKDLNQIIKTAFQKVLRSTETFRLLTLCRANERLVRQSSCPLHAVLSWRWLLISDISTRIMTVS